MIVYGDAVREVSRSRALEHARFEIGLAIRAPGVESVRRSLLQLGEIEQALEDAPGAARAERRDDDACAAARAATDAAADAFERVLGASPADPRVATHAREDLRRAGRALSLVPSAEAPLRVRLPEGFAFYALLPESYRASARRWAGERERASGDDVLVLGVRSIGTALSAVVAAALRACDVRVRRATVRPVGHPFARQVQANVPRASRGIVVDEGPGLSGSSMLAAADLLRRSGIATVDLFPAHAAGPGAAASPAARRRWHSLSSYVAGHGEPEHGARGLAKALWNEIDALRGDEPVECEDWSAGAWRPRLYDQPSQWPAVPRALERTKLVVTGRSGRRVLFKFAGLASAPRGRGSMADAITRRISDLARQGWTAPSLGMTRGFIALEWVAGSPCSASDARPEDLARAVTYLLASARGPLPPRVAREARERLLEMTRRNTTEALGNELAHAAVETLDASGAPPSNMPEAGDGRTAPHEWIRTPEGRIVKTDAGGHELDHTWVGRQPLPWDLAGTILEWDLHGDRAAELVADFEARSGLVVRECLPGFLIACAAHRLGQCRFFADIEPDRLEREILERACGRWREKLVSLISDRATRSERVA